MLTACPDFTLSVVSTRIRQCILLQGAFGCVKCRKFRASIWIYPDAKSIRIHSLLIYRKYLGTSKCFEANTSYRMISQHYSPARRCIVSMSGRGGSWALTGVYPEARGKFPTCHAPYIAKKDRLHIPGYRPGDMLRKPRGRLNTSRSTTERSRLWPVDSWPLYS